MSIIKECLKPIYRYLTSFEYRTFYNFSLHSNFNKRREPTKLKIRDYNFFIPDLMSFAFQYKEMFIHHIYNFSSTTNSPVILDVGANVGLAAIYFKKIYPSAKITCIEADKNISKYLNSNLKANGFADISVIESAAWVNDEGVSFAEDGADGGMVSTASNNKIQSIRLRDVIVKYDHIDFLKMDIEGAELAVLADCGDVLKRVKNIFIEYHSVSKEPQKLNEVLSILESNGFRYYIETINQVSSNPFLTFTSRLRANFDLQLNIFAARVD